MADLGNSVPVARTPKHALRTATIVVAAVVVVILIVIIAIKAQTPSADERFGDSMKRAAPSFRNQDSKLLATKAHRVCTLFDGDFDFHTVAYGIQRESDTTRYDAEYFTARSIMVYCPIYLPKIDYT